MCSCSIYYHLYLYTFINFELFRVTLAQIRIWPLIIVAAAAGSAAAQKECSRGYVDAEEYGGEVGRADLIFQRIAFK